MIFKWQWSQELSLETSHDQFDKLNHTINRRFQLKWRSTNKSDASFPAKIRGSLFKFFFQTKTLDLSSPASGIFQRRFFVTTTDHSFSKKLKLKLGQSIILQFLQRSAQVSLYLIPPYLIICSSLKLRSLRINPRRFHSINTNCNTIRKLAKFKSKFWFSKAAAKPKTCFETETNGASENIWKETKVDPFIENNEDIVYLF